MDKASGAYFWYNTLDESTQWADNGYTEGSTTGAAEEEVGPSAAPLSKQESIRRPGRQDSIKPGPEKQESIKQESVKEESDKQESVKEETNKQESAKEDSPILPTTKSSSELDLKSANDEVKGEVSPSSKLVVSQSAPSLVSEKVTQQE